MNRAFWKGKRVLITGNTGFKGSWLSLLLNDFGAMVTGYSLAPPTQPNLFELAQVSKGTNSIFGDVRDFKFLKEVISETVPDVVLHLAAQTVVRTSYDDPVETYSTNVMGTVNLLEAVRQLDRPCVLVIVTSDKCYENRDWIWGYREDEPMGGNDPYSNSKGCAELVTKAFWKSFFSERSRILVGTGRAGNVIGGGDWTKDQLVPDVMRAFISGKSVRIRNPGAVRPWQFVLEPLDGYLSLAERLCSGGSDYAGGWNFGPYEMDVKPVSWIVENLASLWGGGASWSQDKREHPHEDQILKLDISKATSKLGWSPKLRIEQALEWVVDWYKAYEQKSDLRELTLKQIAVYEKLQPAH
jgi:CDP-glucose 4,6-dehydratase